MWGQLPPAAFLPVRWVLAHRPQQEHA